MGTVPLPNNNGDIVGNVNLVNQVIDAKLAALQNNGGQTDSRLPQPNSALINLGDNCVFTNTCTSPMPFALMHDQRGAGYSRLQGSSVEADSVEALRLTAVAITISGGVVQSNGKGILRAFVSITENTGKVFTTTDFRGDYHFSGMEAQQTYILNAQHKQFESNTQIVSLVQDSAYVNFIGTATNEPILSGFYNSPNKEKPCRQQICCRHGFLPNKNASESLHARIVRA